MERDAVQLALAEEGIPLVEVPQTVRNLSEAMKETESLVYAGRFHHSNHPVMNWMMSNVTVKPDKTTISSRINPRWKPKSTALLRCLQQ